MGPRPWPRSSMAPSAPEMYALARSTASSSAIASNLACGAELEEAVRNAKAYISGALAAMLNLGKGRGPMNHLFDLKSS